MTRGTSSRIGPRHPCARQRWQAAPAVSIKKGITPETHRGQGVAASPILESRWRPAARRGESRPPPGHRRRRPWSQDRPPSATTRRAPVVCAIMCHAGEAFSRGLLAGCWCPVGRPNMPRPISTKLAKCDREDISRVVVVRILLCRIRIAFSNLDIHINRFTSANYAMTVMP